MTISITFSIFHFQKKSFNKKLLNPLIRVFKKDNVSDSSYLCCFFALQVGDLEEFDQLNEDGIEDDCANEEDDDENGDAEYPESEAESLKETEYQVSGSMS